ncbi:hypothetical protein J437_LFUL012515 [Ladona fulva]|uniref:Uncharacterized protein n=1 Tax=Ladona fulva TaxID=123851 RepID=A0A8K0K1B5_LADFU|nr:hypothetical protein J437_LFUL012515 [Ladona fulva]
MDQRVMCCLKVNYRKFLMQSLPTGVDSAEKFSDKNKNVTVPNAINWLTRAIRSLNKESVTKCFQRAEFVFHEKEITDVNNGLNTEIHDLPSITKCNVSAKLTAFVKKDIMTTATDFSTDSPKECSENDAEDK